MLIPRWTILHVEDATQVCDYVKFWLGLTLTMEYRKIGNTGLRVSILGYGASPLGNAYGKTEPAEVTRAIRHAFAQGINFFDVSPYYGATLAEERLGVGLEGIRDQVVLMTKCGRYGLDDFDFTAARIHRSIDESLTRLRTDHVDILLAHDIEFGDMNQIINETIPALRSIQQQGKAQYIGVSGLPLGVLKQAVETGMLDVVLSYCHYNLLIQDLDKHLTPVAKKWNVGLINASPLHMGILTKEGQPGWHPAPDSIKQAGRDLSQYCEAKGVSLPQTAIRFALDYAPVASTLVGMISVSEVDTNLKAISNANDPELIQELLEIAAPIANQSWPSGRPENSDALLLGIPQR